MVTTTQKISIFTFKVVVSVNPSDELIVYSRVRTNGHRVGEMVPINNKCLSNTMHGLGEKMIE